MQLGGDNVGQIWVDLDGRGLNAEELARESRGTRAPKWVKAVSNSATRFSDRACDEFGGEGFFEFDPALKCQRLCAGVCPQGWDVAAGGPFKEALVGPRRIATVG